MPKAKQLERFAELVRRHIIHRHPLPSAEMISKEFELSKRSAYRDLEILKTLALELNNFGKHKAKDE